MVPSKFLTGVCVSPHYALYRVFDTLNLSRKTIHTIENYRLKTIASHLGINTTGIHRAETDANIV